MRPRACGASAHTRAPRVHLCARYKSLQRALDPLRTSELSGYLSFAGIFGGGVLYLALIFVQVQR